MKQLSNEQILAQAWSYYLAGGSFVQAVKDEVKKRERPTYAR